jgi:hypothetical protein
MVEKFVCASDCLDLYHVDAIWECHGDAILRIIIYEIDDIRFHKNHEVGPGIVDEGKNQVILSPGKSDPYVHLKSSEEFKLATQELIFCRVYLG